MGFFRRRGAGELRSKGDSSARMEERGEALLEAEGALAQLLLAAGRDGPVSEEDAMGIPALAGCLEFICSIAASVPLRLYRKRENSDEEVTDDPRLRLLNEDTRDLLTGPEWKAAFFLDYLLHGRAWAYLHKTGNQLRSVHYVEDRSVNVMMNEDPIFKSAVVYVRERAYQPWEFIRMARHTRTGVRGKGLLEQARGQLNMALNYIHFENAVVKGGGNKRGFLQSDRKLLGPELTDLKDSFDQMYGSSYDGVVVLNKGVTFTPAQATSVEMQLSENKERNREEICSLLCIPPSILTGKATMEEFDRAIRVAVLPLLGAFDKAVNRAVLLENEKDTLYFSCDTRDLESGDVLKRYNAYTAACRAGWLSKNEIRHKEKYKAIPGLDVVSMSLGDVVYDIPTRKFFVPNTGQAANMTAVEAPAPDSGEGGTGIGD